MIQSRDTLTVRHVTITEHLNDTNAKVDRTRTALAQIIAESRAVAQKETELNEKLVNITSKMTHMKIDLQVNERNKKYSEMLGNLKRAFVGVHGRVSDLIVPSQQKYSTAINILLGRNMDAIIVDTEKTAIQCIQVNYTTLTILIYSSCVNNVLEGQPLSH